MAAERFGMAELRYAVILEPEPDGSAFNVIVPALPEVATFGDTPEHAIAMAREAITHRALATVSTNFALPNRTTHLFPAVIPPGW